MNQIPQSIVVDDGSEDESIALAAQFDGVQILRGAHAGIGTTLNRGLRHGDSDLMEHHSKISLLSSAHP